MQRTAGQHDDLARLPVTHAREGRSHGRLPRGIGIARLRDAPAEWSKQHAMLGLSS
jgi:hypothetical protein